MVLEKASGFHIYFEMTRLILAGVGSTNTGLGLKSSA